MARVLVVGGSGFVGLAVVRALLAQGHAVTLLNRGNRPVQGTRQLVADRNDRGEVSLTLAQASFDVAIDTNCYTPAQARTLLDSLVGAVRRILVISSVAVYADHAARPPAEDQPRGGASVWGDYGRGKSGVEDAYQAASGSFEHCAIVRPPYIFGPANSSDRETWFWRRQLSGWPVLLPGDGSTQANFIHVDDLALAISRLACGERRGFEIFNVADPRPVSFSQLASLLAEVASAPDRQMQAGEKAAGIPARSWFPFRDYPCLADPTAFMAATGWSPEATLRDRFAQTLAAYPGAELGAGFAPPQLEAALQEAVQASRCR